MRCPLCGTADCFINFFGGWDCLNPKCKHFKHGHKDGVSALELAARKATETKNNAGVYPVGMKVLVHRGPGWDNKDDGVWMIGTIVKYHADGIPQDFYTVSLDREETMKDGIHTVPAGHYWLSYPQHITVLL